MTFVTGTQNLSQASPVTISIAWYRFQVIPHQSIRRPNCHHFVLFRRSNICDTPNVALTMVVETQNFAGMLLGSLLADSNRFQTILAIFGKCDIFVTLSCHRCDICCSDLKLLTDIASQHIYSLESIMSNYRPIKCLFEPVPFFDTLFYAGVL